MYFSVVSPMQPGNFSGHEERFQLPDGLQTHICSGSFSRTALLEFKNKAAHNKLKNTVIREAISCIWSQDLTAPCREGSGSSQQALTGAAPRKTWRSRGVMWGPSAAPPPDLWCQPGYCGSACSVRTGQLCPLEKEVENINPSVTACSRSCSHWTPEPVKRDKIPPNTEILH